MYNRDQIVAKLLEYLSETNPIIISGASVPTDKSLYELGFLDSFGVVEMVMYIENYWDIKVSNKDLTKERFGGLDKMANVIFELLQNKSVG